MDFLGDPKSKRFVDVIKYSNRPFKSVKEMDKEMIRRWNNKVGKEDIVLHLEDFACLLIPMPKCFKDFNIISYCNIWFTINFCNNSINHIREE